MMVRHDEGQNEWLIIPKRCLLQWGLGWWFLRRFHILGTQATLTKENIQSHPPRWKPLSLGNIHHPGGMSQNTFGATRARFSVKLWPALSVLNHRTGCGGGEVFSHLWLLKSSTSPMTGLSEDDSHSCGDTAGGRAEPSSLGAFTPNCVAFKRHSFSRWALFFWGKKKSLFPLARGYSKLQFTMLPISTHVHGQTRAHAHTRTHTQSWS